MASASPMPARRMGVPGQQPGGLPPDQLGVAALADDGRPPVGHVQVLDIEQQELLGPGRPSRRASATAGAPAGRGRAGRGRPELVDGDGPGHGAHRRGGPGASSARRCEGANRPAGRGVQQPPTAATALLARLAASGGQIWGKVRRPARPPARVVSATPSLAGGLGAEGLQEQLLVFSVGPGPVVLPVGPCPVHERRVLVLAGQMVVVVEVHRLFHSRHRRAVTPGPEPGVWGHQASSTSGAGSHRGPSTWEGSGTRTKICPQTRDTPGPNRGCSLPELRWSPAICMEVRTPDRERRST